MSNFFLYLFSVFTLPSMIMSASPRNVCNIGMLVIFFYYDMRTATELQSMCVCIASMDIYSLDENIKVFLYCL